MLVVAVGITVRSLPEVYMERTLKFVASSLESTHHVEFYLIWIQHLLTACGPRVQSQMTPILLTLHKNLTKKYEELAKL